MLPGHDSAPDHLQTQIVLNPLLWLKYLLASLTTHLFYCPAAPCPPRSVPPRREYVCHDSCEVSSDQREEADQCTEQWCEVGAVCGGSGGSDKQIQMNNSNSSCFVSV